MPEDKNIATDPATSATIERIIAVAELADELGTHRATIFKIAKRLGIQPFKRKDSTRGGQQISLITEAEATAIRAEFSEGRRSRDQNSSDMMFLTTDEGWFYLIQLEPEHDPGRLKVGFTTDLEGRIRQHRCAAPLAKYIKYWPCRRTWEKAAIDCMTNGLEKIHTEVFRASEVEEITGIRDRFFSLMSSINLMPESNDEEAT